MNTIVKLQRNSLRMISILRALTPWYPFGRRLWKWCWTLSQVRIGLYCTNMWSGAHHCKIDEETNKIPDVSIVEASAELLYGLVHQRYILTRMGLQAMVCYESSCSYRLIDLSYELFFFQVEKYEQGIFGACPRVFCNGTHVVPCGRTDIPGHDTVKLYCPNCSDIYTPPSSRFQGVDGKDFYYFQSTCH